MTSAGPEVLFNERSFWTYVEFGSTDASMMSSFDVCTVLWTCGCFQSFCGPARIFNLVSCHQPNPSWWLKFYYATYETRTLHSKLKIASSKPIRIQNENAFNANTKKKECLLQVQSTLYCFKRPVNERLETNARPRHTDNKAFLLRHLLTARENVDPKFSSVCDDCMY